MEEIAQLTRNELKAIDCLLCFDIDDDGKK